jgi:hypothetical protein
LSPLGAGGGLSVVSPTWGKVFLAAVASIVAVVAGMVARPRRAVEWIDELADVLSAITRLVHRWRDERPRWRRPPDAGA